MDSNAKLPEKIKLVIYLGPPVLGNENWKWTEADMTRIMTTMKEFMGKRISRPFELLQTADVLLLVQEVTEVDSSLYLRRFYGMLKNLMST